MTPVGTTLHQVALLDDTDWHTSQERHLAEQERLLAALTEQLAEREAEFASSGADFARFRVAYIARFAPLYAELDRLEAEILRLVAERTPPGTRRAERARTEADQAQARADESEQAASGAEDDPGPRPAPSAGLRALYRRVARAIHPDLADEDDRERRTRLMAAASRAYADGDEVALKRILDDEAQRSGAVRSGEPDGRDEIAARLARVLRQIAKVRERLSELIALQEAVAADPMWRLFGRVRVAIERGGDPLHRTELRLRERIRARGAQLADMRLETPSGADR